MNETTAIRLRSGGVQYDIATSIAKLMFALLIATLCACATRPAPDFGGRWKEVNRYAEAPQEIPLYQAYTFYPSPMDRTLRNMLSRWAKDSKMSLSYLHASDFTLHSAVASIRTSSVDEAAMQLTAAYAAQGVSVSVDGSQIVVRADTTATSGSETAVKP